MTSGNIAVFDHDATRFTDFVVAFNRLFEIDKERTEHVERRVQELLGSKEPGQPDSHDLTQIQAVIRQGERRADALGSARPAVPRSLDDVEQKKTAILRHQSQKGRAVFPGSVDPREFWQRAEDRNRETAKSYDKLGLPEFYALEGFVQWRG